MVTAAARWLRAGLEIALVTTAAVLVVYHSKGGCRLARRSRYNDEIMTYSNMLCCPTPYAISASGYSLASLAGVVGLAATERGHGVSAAATEALGSVCCCCRLRRDAGPVAVAFAGLMLFGLAVLSLFKAGGCVSYWWVHSLGSFLFFTFGFGLLAVLIFSRRGGGCVATRCDPDLAFFAGWTRGKAVATALGLVSLPVRGVDALASEYMQIAGIFLAVLAFERDVAAGAAALAAAGEAKEERPPDAARCCASEAERYEPARRRTEEAEEEDGDEAFAACCAGGFSPPDDDDDPEGLSCFGA